MGGAKPAGSEGVTEDGIAPEQQSCSSPSALPPPTSRSQFACQTRVRSRRHRRHLRLLAGVYQWPLRPSTGRTRCAATSTTPGSRAARARSTSGSTRRPQRHPRPRSPRRHRPPPRPRRPCRCWTATSAFGYWHIIPAVRHHQRINRHQLVGHVAAPWLHVHFAERRAGIYRDPLRPGALTPWQDTTKPRVTRIVFSRNGRVLSPTSIFGPVDVIAEAHQLPARKVPPPWDGLPVTPARIRWRVRRGGHTMRAWHTPIDLSKTLLPTDRVPAGLRAGNPAEPGKANLASTASISPTAGARPCSWTAPTGSRSKPPTSEATKAACTSPSRSPTTSNARPLSRTPTTFARARTRGTRSPPPRGDTVVGPVLVLPRGRGCRRDSSRGDS